MRSKRGSIFHSPRWILFFYGLRTAKVAVSSTIFIRVLTAALPTLTVVAAGSLATETVRVIADHGQGALLGPAVVVMAAYALGLLLPALQNLPDMSVRTKVDADIRARVVRACALPATVAHLEDPELLDAISLVRSAAPRQRSVGGGVLGILGPLDPAVGLIGPTIVLATWRWPLAVAVVIVTIALQAFVQVQSALFSRTFLDRVRSSRRSTYLADLALEGVAGKELRLFGMTDWLQDAQKTEWYSGMRAVWADQGRIRNRLNAGAVGGTLVTVALILVLAFDARDGRLGVGALVSLLGAIRLINGLEYSVDEETINAGVGTEILRDLLRLEEVVGRLEMTGRASALGLPAVAVRFENVSFHYPGTSREIYAGLDLEIRAGESLAIVGANGAGKTTLVKLLGRLYDVTGGQITADGVPLTTLDPFQWQRRVACLFQDFTHFPLTLADNVALGAPELSEDRGAIERALERAGAGELAKGLDKGLDTLLTNKFAGGTDLSGGQWQRVALARALLAVEAGGRHPGPRRAHRRPRCRSRGRAL